MPNTGQHVYRCNSATRSFTYAFVTCHFLFSFLFILKRLVLPLVSSHQLSIRVTGSHLSFLSPPRCAKTSGAETNEKIILSVKVLDVLSATPKSPPIKDTNGSSSSFCPSGLCLIKTCSVLFYWTAVNTLFQLVGPPQLKISFWGGVGKKTQNQLKM